MEVKENVIELRDRFYGRGSVSGYTFEQVAKSDSAYLYGVRLYDKGDDEENEGSLECGEGLLFKDFTGSFSHFEVFKRRVRSEPIFNENVDEFVPVVLYPGDNAFGMWAWTYTVFKSAVEKYQELGGVL